MKKAKVMIVGASGAIGRSLTLLISKSEFVSQLILNDLAPTEGIATELNHLDKYNNVSSGTLAECDKDINIVILVCGKPQNNANEKRDDLFKANASIYKSIIETVGPRLASSTIYLVVGNPVNSLTVIVTEVLKKLGKYEEGKVIGFNELDVVRSKKMVGSLFNVDLKNIDVPLIGGHSEKTIFPVLDSAKYLGNDSSKFPNGKISLSDEQKNELFAKIRSAGDDVLKAYNNMGTASLSTAYSCYILVKKICNASDKQTSYAYIECNEPGLPAFFTVPVQLSLTGGAKCLKEKLKEIIKLVDEGQKNKLIEEVKHNITTAKNFLENKS
ncbi:MAG: hypothetical protein MHPSP_002671 [Paramarteilia canceri]